MTLEEAKSIIIEKSYTLLPSGPHLNQIIYEVFENGESKYKKLFKSGIDNWVFDDYQLIKFARKLQLGAFS